eukprot:364267-Chlamydomonas_euryale.AAC.6
MRTQPCELPISLPTTRMSGPPFLLHPPSMHASTPQLTLIVYPKEVSAARLSTRVQTPLPRSWRPELRPLRRRGVGAVLRGEALRPAVAHAAPSGEGRLRRDAGRVCSWSFVGEELG